MPEDYSAYVPHPRFGQKPRFTDINPNEAGRPYFGWRTKGMIRGTAIRADWRKQQGTCIFRTHYFDLRRECIDCGKPFIFYAEEQRHWYEELSFSVDADCIRCATCRKKTQAFEKAKRRYEELSRIIKLSADEALEMAEICIHLVETGTFSQKQVSHIRELLNKATKQSAPTANIERLKARTNAIPKTDG